MRKTFIDTCVMECYFLEQFVHTHNAPDATLRQRLDRIPTASPDLFGVILKEGKV